MTKIKELHLDSGSEQEHGVKKKQALTGRKKYFKEKGGRNLLQRRRKHDWVSERRVSPKDPGKE